MPQGLPQGSILVVPSSSVLQQAPGHGFSPMPLLPVFANTAVIMPQNVPHPSHLGTCCYIVMLDNKYMLGIQLFNVVIN